MWNLKGPSKRLWDHEKRSVSFIKRSKNQGNVQAQGRPLQHEIDLQKPLHKQESHKSLQFDH